MTERDLAERERAEEALRASEEKYRTLFESIDEGFCVIEVLFDDADHPLDYRFVEVNPAFEKQTGIENAVGRRMREIAPQHEEHWFRIYGRVALTGEPLRFKNSAAALGRYYDVYAFRIGQPEERRVAILFNDITERKQTEADHGRLIQELCEAQEQLRAELDATSRLLEISSLFVKAGNREAVLGAIVEAAIAISSADFGTIQLLDPESGDLKIAAQRGFPPWWLEFWDYVRKGHGSCGTALDRRERVVIEDVEQSPLFMGTPALEIQLKAGVRAVQSTPLMSRAGEPIGMLSTHYRTPGRPSDRALRLLDLLARQAADILERAQAELALEQANQRLLEADRRKNEFLGMLSHELRNPIAPIRNSIYILERAVPGEEQALRAQAVIDRQIGHMTRLIDDLLDVTRITNGKALLQRELLDLNELARLTVEDHRGAFVESGVELEMLAAPVEVWVNGDRTRLAQVIGNLLQNAVKFTPRGGKTTVFVEGDSIHGQAIVRVRDTGRGIAPEILPRLFEPFTQADTTLDRSKGGLGLGLALVKGLVKMHGGAVSAASGGSDRGATFTITLPLEPIGPTETRPPRAGTGKAPRRVLLIEDNADAANSLLEVLKLCGHDVEVAYTGPDGIEKARAFGPEVVICDIGLPEMNGYEVARALRADPQLGRVTLVTLTGYAGPEDMAKAKAAGFDAHLAKPSSIEALERVLAGLETALRATDLG
jgi:PAS domain S-box-containing protein